MFLCRTDGLDQSSTRHKAALSLPPMLDPAQARTRFQITFAAWSLWLHRNSRRASGTEGASGRERRNLLAWIVRSSNTSHAHMTIGLLAEFEPARTGQIRFTEKGLQFEERVRIVIT